MDGTLQSEGELLQFKPNVEDLDIQNGTWKYYHKNGILSYKLVYENGKFLKYNGCWNKKGEAIDCK